MNYTTYYKLQKPLDTEQYNIEVHNANSDILDSELERLAQKNIVQDQALNEEVQRACAKEEEILSALHEGKPVWDNKYTREETDDKLSKIPIPTKTSDLENDCGFSAIAGIKGGKENEYHRTGDVNLTAADVGAMQLIELYGTSSHVIDLDVLTDSGIYKIYNDDVMWVKFNNGNSQIDCRQMDLFVGGSDRFKYQIIFPLDYYKKFRIRFMTKSENGITEFSIWDESATLNDLLSYIDAHCVKHAHILNTKEQIDANTSNENVAGALAVKQIKNDLEQQITAAVSGVTGVKGNAESAYRTGNVNLTAGNIGAVNKAGDTMGGNLIMKNVCLTDGVHSRVVIEMHDDGDGATNYGSDLLVSAAGNTFVGSGESASSLRNKLTSGASEGEYYAKVGERLYITSDQNIYFYSNCNNILQRTGIQYDVSGSLRPLINDTNSLGSSTTKWAHAYATTFHGNLDGNAIKDGNGDVIAKTYALKSIYGDTKLTPGTGNNSSSSNGVAVGGRNNMVSITENNAVLGGEGNTVYGACSAIVGGLSNFIETGGAYAAVVAGYHALALGCDFITGHYNNGVHAEASGNTSGTGVGTAFCIGNGTSSARSNAARIDYNGKLWCKAPYSSAGADYAELFEWEDGNPNNEDRRGRFVTMDCDKIKIASSDDSYILGIVSANPCVLGNTDMEWQGQFLKDDFGAYLIEEFTEIQKRTRYVPEIDEDGNPVLDENGEQCKIPEEYEEEISGTRYVLNPDYESGMEYVDRMSRPEWDAIGMMGVLSVYDDGTCEANGFCICNDKGIATASDTGYRVIKRVTDNIIKVIFR